MSKTTDPARKHVLIVGSGASGMMAACAAASHGAGVTLIDRMQQPGTKLLMTGNGRCNLSNSDPDLPEKYFCSGGAEDLERVKRIFHEFGQKDTIRYFQGIGLEVTDRDGWIYPRSETAASVLGLLRRQMQLLGVKLRLNTPIEKAYYDTGKKKWITAAGNWEYESDALILACGSKAVPSTGSDGSGYALARMNGHTIVPVLPALTALESPAKWLKWGAGTRTRGTVKLVKLHADASESLSDPIPGQIQWLQESISGIPVFLISGAAAAAISKGQNTAVFVDFFPEYSEEQLKTLLSRIFSDGTAPGVLRLSGLLPEGTARMILASANLDKKNAGELLPNVGELAGLLKNFPVPVSRPRGFEQCQVCTGGVPLFEIDPGTMQSRIAHGLYLCGELLDPAGPCGGYNLQWAWSTGYIAGKNAAE